MADENDKVPGSDVTPPADDRGDNFTPTAPEIPDLGGEFDPEILKGIAGDEPPAGVDKDKGGEPPAGVDKDKGDGKSIMIPKERLDEETARRRLVEEENERLREQVKAKGDPAKDAGEPSTLEPSAVEKLNVELDAKIIEAEEALLSNRMEDHRALQKEISRINREIAKEELRTETAQTTARSQAQSEMDTVANKAYEIYPFLNIKTEQKNDAAIGAVVALRNSFIAQGKTPAAALQLAVDQLGPVFAKSLGFEKAPEGETADAKRVREEREAAARKKAGDASLGQPPVPAGGERESTFKVDVTKLSDKEFEALPASVKAKLRGDTV